MEQPAVITITVTEFRNDFPYFADKTMYGDTRVDGALTQAACYVSDVNCGILRNNCRRLALELMSAHLLIMDDYLAGGQVQPAMASSSTASIDKVSVSKGFAAPPFSNSWQYWLGLSTFGLRFLALLNVKAAAGLLVGGSPQRRIYS